MLLPGRALSAAVEPCMQLHGGGQVLLGMGKEQENDQMQRNWETAGSVQAQGECWHVGWKIAFLCSYLGESPFCRCLSNLESETGEFFYI